MTVLKMTALTLCLFLNSAYGAEVKDKKNLSDNEMLIQINKLGKRISVKSENGVCAMAGPRAYQIKSDEAGNNFALVCKVREPDLHFDSEIPVELIENFAYPKSIYADMRAWRKDYGGTEAFIKSVKHPWGTEYYWSTPSSGSTKYSYLCPEGSKICVRIKVGGLEKLTFNVINMRK